MTCRFQCACSQKSLSRLAAIAWMFLQEGGLDPQFHHGLARLGLNGPAGQSPACSSLRAF